MKIVVEELIRELGPCAPGKIGVVYGELLRQNSMEMQKIPPVVPVIAPPVQDQLDFPPPLYLPDDISQSITVLTCAVKPPVATQQKLPVDAYGRPYMVVVNPYEDTAQLAEAAIEFFLGCGAVLKTVRLSCFGYLTALPKLQEMQPYISFEHVYDPNFTIMLQGEPWTS